MNRNWILGVLTAAITFGCATAQKPAEDARTASNLSKSAAFEREHCLRDTGSRIKRPDDKSCISAPGSSYSQRELEDTGQFDLADALKQLDPTIQ